MADSAEMVRGVCRGPAVARPAVVAVWATAVQLKTARAVPMGPVLCGGGVDAAALDREAGVRPVSEPAEVAADVAVAVVGEGVECCARVLTVMAGGVEDDLVIAV
jgi:hypothetical protein